MITVILRLQHYYYVINIIPTLLLLSKVLRVNISLARIRWCCHQSDVVLSLMPIELLWILDM